MKIPRGELLRARVVLDPAGPLESALERGLTGYASLDPQDTLLLDHDAHGVVTFEDGIPVLVYNSATDRGGADALADLAVPGPYRVELYEVDAAALAEAHDTPELRVPPGMPAEALADAPGLAERTRRAAPDDRLEAGDDASAAAAFLDDDERIEAIREQARREAAERAEEWGLADQLDEDVVEQADTDSGDEADTDFGGEADTDSGDETDTDFGGEADTDSGDEAYADTDGETAAGGAESDESPIGADAT